MFDIHERARAMPGQHSEFLYQMAKNRKPAESFEDRHISWHAQLLDQEDAQEILDKLGK